MASKKCPKCGEDNPAEAVMCWACYTPLSGAPAMAVPGMTVPGMAGAGAGVASRGAMSGAAGNPAGIPNTGDDTGAKKGVDPKLIGGGAFLVIAGLVAFFVTNSMKTTEAVLPTSGIDPGVVTPGIAPPLQPPPGVIPLLPAPGPNPPPAVVEAPFKLVSPPNPNFATGTAGVVSTKTGLTPVQSAGIARFAKNQLTRNGKWANMQICVFSTQQAADAFATYQNNRKGKPLGGGDYQQLAAMGVWSGTAAYLDVKGKTEGIYYPSANAGTWWSSLR